MDKPMIREAIDVLGGRVERVAVLCDVSVTTVYGWLQDGCVWNSRYCVAVWRACERIEPGKITIEGLAGYTEDAQGNPIWPDRSGDRGGTIRQKAPTPVRCGVST
jgi:hypothetical protein